MSSIQGKIEVHVNETKTNACLIYTPDPSGTVWMLKEILALLEEEKIVHGIDQDSIKEALASFEGKEKKIRSPLIAQGKQPRALSPVRFKLKEKKLNDELTEKMHTVLEQSDPPDLKEEVDPKVRESSFAKKGERVGTLSDPHKKAMGISVYGEEIPPDPTSTAAPFYVGENLEVKKGSNIVALITGFVRVGENWVDLVPSRGHKWNLLSGNDKKSILLEFIPGKAELPPPTGEEILSEVLNTGCDDQYLVSSVEIDQFIAKTIELGKKGQFPLSKSRNGKVVIEINSMKTKAELVLEKGLGSGKALSLKEVSRILNESKLKSMDSAKIKEQIMAFQGSPDSEVRILLCEGTLPQRGKDRAISFSVKFLEESYLDLLIDKVELDPSLISRYKSVKTFPMDKINYLAMVEKGQTVLSLGAESKGTNGKDIYGEVIPGLTGNDPILNLFEHIEMQKGSAIASRSGILELSWDKDKNICLARVREHTNAPIRVRISENKMLASISIGLARGTGFPADNTMIEEALQAAGVTEGYIQERIDEASEASCLGEVLADQVVAEGKLPIDEGRELKLIQDIDYRDKQNNYVPIKAGEEIGQLVKDSQDDNVGFTVTGEDLKPESDDNEITIGENIDQVPTDEEGVVKLVAFKSGRLIFTKAKLFIQDTILIEGDLSPHMGKIVFPGNVMVAGTVLSKAMVKSGESIVIQGVVQAALVSGKGIVKIKKGIKGSQKAVIRGQILEFEYAEEANLMAAEKIICSKAIMRCQVKCNGQIVMTAANSKVLGGEIKVRDGFIVHTIGNDRGVETAIHFGQDYLVEDKIASSMREQEKVQMQILRLDEIIDKARGRPDKQELMMGARDKKVRILKVMEKKSLKLFLLREKFEEHFSSTIKVTGTLHEGTSFYSHGRELIIDKNRTSVEIFFDMKSGKISERPLT